MSFPLVACPKHYRAERKAKKRTAERLPFEHKRANGCGHTQPDKNCGPCKRKLLTRTPKRCLQCKADFWPYKHNKGMSKFCSSRCYFQNNRLKGFELLDCGYCGKAFTRRKVRTRTRKNVFCSKECIGPGMRGEKNPLWRGPKDPNRGPEWRRLAEQIRERDGCTCRRCGKTQAENKQKLSVDHVVPWRAFENKADANHPENLVSLCRSCHQKKTIGAERRWLQGDVLGLRDYRRSVGIAS